MTKNEALKMAIEALSQDEGWFEPEAAIKACKEALEQPASKNIRDSFNEMLEDKVAYYKGKQPARLVSYAPDKSTCTLNIDGEEVYFNRAVHVERSADDESTIA